MNTKLGHVVAMVNDRPWFIIREHLDQIAAIVAFHADGGRLTGEEIRARLDAAQAARGDGARSDGTSLPGWIPIRGAIFPRANLMTDISGGATVSGIRASLRAALEDPGVNSILLDFDSPGGYTDGIEELAAEIRAARGTKPIVAISNYCMASAAYYLGSQADEIVATPSSMTGWIGTVLVHQEFSKMDEQAGVTTTIFRDPPDKYAGNEYEPLSQAGAGSFQQQVGDFSVQFVNAAAKGRGVSPATVRADFGGGMGMTAARAKAAGLVDRVDTFDNTIARLAKGKVAMRPLALRAEDERPALEARAEEERPAGPPVDDVQLRADAALELARAHHDRRR